MKDVLPVSVSYPDNLPVSGRVAEIKAALEQHQVIIVAGETGSGKTTQLPKICLEMGRGTKGRIGHTQPRRLAARTVAMRIAEELGDVGQQVVSFQVRFSDTSTAQTRVKVMTDGILLAETRQDRLLKKYDTIIIDEAHERSLNIDFLLGYLKGLLPKRPDLKIIITSATIDVEKFSEHFQKAPVIEVSGRTYPVDIIYKAPEEESEPLELGEQVLAAYDLIRQRERQHPLKYKDILVFLSGEREIRDTADLLRKQNISGLEILPLYARLSNKEQQRVFSSHPGRRIVLTTNVAETSLTVPGIGYVIDSGTARISRYSVRSKIQRLPVEAISQASANQRAGRCGRLGPGVCIRLYSETDFLNRSEFTDTEITRTNLASVILQMLSLRLGDISRFPFLESPDPRAIRDGYRLLSELKAVNSNNKLSTDGRLMARLPVDPRLARVLVEASRLSCLKEALIIISALASQDPRERPLEKQQAADEAHRRFCHQDSDFCTWLNLWAFYEENRQELGSSQLRKFCQRNFLSWMRMREWREVHRQLLLMCNELKLSLNKNAADFDQIHMALLSGFISQVSNRLDDGTYLGARSRKYAIFPGSVLFKKSSRWLLSAELVETSQLYARMNAKVEPEWIEQQGAHLLKSEFSEPHWERKKGQVIAFEKVSLFGLVLVEKRRRRYSPIDPTLSREIFIRDALTARRLNSRLAFYHHNRKLTEDIEQLEERSRRRDILVEEERIYAFYDSKLPETVVDAPSLERWCRKLSASEAAALKLTEADLVNEQAEGVDTEQFPQQLKVNDLKLSLDYVFDPGKTSDGISADVPVTALKQLRNEDLDWLVPGMLREKCIAMIKALPRQLRKNFVPVPDVVDKVVPLLKREDGSLQDALARQLLRLTMVQLPPGIWDELQLPEHLQMNIRVLDEQGQVISSGRSLQELKEALGARVQESLRQAGSQAHEEHGMTTWSFGELPEVSEVMADKLKVKAYPALIDKIDSVDLVLMDSEYSARLASIRGVSRLLLLSKRQQHRYLKKNILQNPRKLAALNSLGQREALLDELILRAAIIAYGVEETLPRTEQQFNTVLESGSNKVLSVATELETLLVEILEQRMDLLKRLKRGFSSPADLLFRQDVEMQLNSLIYPGFLHTIPWLHLQQLPRYLQAIVLRMEKYGSQLSRDQQWTRMLQQRWSQYVERRDYCQRHEKADEGLDEYRWLLEELRVSLFAQSLGTRVPVSEKRLDKFWRDSVI